MIEDQIRQVMSEFNERAKTDPMLREELAGFDRIVSVKLDDGQAFNFKVSNCLATDLQKGLASDAQIVLESDSETLDKLIKKEIRIMKAIATRKLRVHASLEDMLRLRKFF